MAIPKFDAIRIQALKLLGNGQTLKPKDFFHLFGGLFQLHGAKLLHHRLSLFSGCSFALLGMDCLKHLGHQLHL